MSNNDNEKREIVDVYVPPLEAQIFRLSLDIGVSDKYFAPAVQAIYSQAPYGKSLYSYVAEQTGASVNTIKNHIQRIPTRARKKAPDLYESISGTNKLLKPLDFLVACAVWLARNRIQFEYHKGNEDLPVMRWRTMEPDKNTP